METLNFYVGILSSFLLVLGSALPNSTKKPRASTKEGLFLVGNFGMFTYATVGAMNGAPIFFVFLEVLCATSSVLTMLEVEENKSQKITVGLGLILLVSSFLFFKNTSTILFILGLTGVGLGFVTRKEVERNRWFLVGCILLTIFSGLEQNWIFTGMNAAFGAFSLFHLLKARGKR